MGASIKLISINAERSLHLDLIVPFLEMRRPEVVCVQELLERDIPRFEKIIGPCRAFGIDGLHPADPPETGSLMEGNGIFAPLPVVSTDVHYYAGSEEHARTRLPKVIPDDVSIVSCEVEKEGKNFHFLTTHFTWSARGKAVNLQRENMNKLLKYLENLKEFVLIGDFNAPRGGEIFAMLAGRYKDNVPPHYTSSIDPNLHRAGRLELMVDGIFSTPLYAVSDVEIVSGVSDHCALVATVSTAHN